MKHNFKFSEGSNKTRDSDFESCQPSLPKPSLPIHRQQHSSKEIQSIASHQVGNVNRENSAFTSTRTNLFKLIFIAAFFSTLGKANVEPGSAIGNQSETEDYQQTTQKASVNSSTENLSLDFDMNHIPGTLIVTLKPSASLIPPPITNDSDDSQMVPPRALSELQDEVRHLHQSAGIQEIRKLRGRASDRDRLVIKYEKEQSLLTRLAQQYSNSDMVESVSLDYLAEATFIPNDSRFSELWGMKKIAAPEAWNRRTNAENIVVAVLDTGLDYNHSELASNIWTNPWEVPGDGIDNDENGFIDDVIGWNFVGNNSDPIDDHIPIYHGTHVAGTIGAVGNNGSGIAGVAWNVQIMPVKVLDSKGMGSLSNIIEGIEYAIENGADVINMCLGGTGTMPPELHASLLLAKRFKVIAVIAAGNNGYDVDQSSFWPGNATLDNIVTVINTDSYDERPKEVGGMVLKYDGEKTYFTWGKRYKTNFGRFHTDLSAPGTQIFSTAASNGYQFLSGTSMATPHVAGAIALIWSEYHNDTYTNIIDRVLGNVDLLTDLEETTGTGGRLNLNRCFDGITRIIHGAIRGYVGPANERLIQGFTVIGNSAKKIILTSAGPSLAPLIGDQVVEDTSIALFGPNGFITSNDDFVSLPDSKLLDLARIFATPENAKESAIVETLDPGVYTVVMDDPQNAYGIGLLNLYEANGSDVLRFAGCSSRVNVGTGDKVGILSFVVSGKGKRRILIKTNGSGLSDFGISHALDNPKIELYQGSTLVAENDDWMNFDGPSHALEEELNGRGIVVPSEKDALIYENLPQGIYTVIVKGVNGATGICLLEIIEYR